MRIFFRHNLVILTTTFYDLDGEVADVDTATLLLMYPAAGTSLTGTPSQWPFNGDDLTKATIEMTEDADTHEWSGTWDSLVSQPGIVYWHAYTSDTGTASQDGNFKLRGNYANLQVLAS